MRTFATQASHKIELLPDSPNYKQVESIPDVFRWDGTILHETVHCARLALCLSLFYGKRLKNHWMSSRLLSSPEMIWS